MRRRKQWAMLAVSTAVLAGAWLLAESMERESAAEAAALESPVPEAAVLSVGRAGELTALSWSWEGETVNLAREASGRWVNADDESCPIDAAAAERLAVAAAGVTATAALEDDGDLARYGLDKPSLTVVAATEDTIAEYAVGNMTVAGEVYLRRKGDDAVYRTDGSLAAFRVGIDDLLALDRMPENVQTATGLAVTSEAGDYELRYRTDPAPGWYRVDGDEPAALEGETPALLCQTLLSTELSDCETWNAADPGAYGLDEPQLRAKLFYTEDTGREASFSLEFGDYAEGGVYARVPGSAMVFLVDAAVTDGLMYPDWAAMEPAAVLTPDLERVARIRIGLGEREVEVLRLEETTERAVGEGDETVEVTDVIYSMNGWVLDTDAVEDWLRAVTGLTADGAAPTGEGRQTLLTLTLVWKDEESVPAELELRRYDSAHALCILGDDRYLLVDRDAAEAAVSAAESLFTTE